MVSGSSRARTVLPVAVAVVAGCAVIAAAFVFVRQTQGDRSGCVTLNVVSSTEKSDLMARLATRYNDSGRRFDGGCANVVVDGLTSGKAMEALATDWSRVAGAIPKPQVWLPTSSLWTGQLRLRDVAAGRAEQTPQGSAADIAGASIANSPLVIAMPGEKGRHLQQVSQQRGGLGWGDILGMSGDKGWATFDKPEWGRFTFGKDNPNLSTSGLAATIATYYAATGGTSSDLTTADVEAPAVTQFVRRIEGNVSHYSDDVVDLLRDLAEADLAGAEAASASEVSAIVMQEELVYLYNEGMLSPNGHDKPREPLVALYPKEGTFNLDHPYVVLPHATEQQRKAAADFKAYVKEQPQQDAFAEIGFRDHDRVASDDLTEVVGAADATVRRYFTPPQPQVVQTILGSWGTLRKKANILMVVDTSGSMSTPISGLDGNRLTVATAAAKKGIDLLNSQDRVGLWSFSSEPNGSREPPYREQVPVGPLNVADFTARIDALQLRGDTALYTSVRAAHRYMTEHYDPARINAVVVLTDGVNDYAKDDDLNRLLQDVSLVPGRPVKVFCIAFDHESQFAPLDRISKASAGKAFDATDPKLIDEAFVKLLSSF